MHLLPAWVRGESWIPTALPNMQRAPPEDSSLPQTAACGSEGASIWVVLPPPLPRRVDWAVGHTEGNGEWELGLGSRKCGFVRSGSCPSVLAARKVVLVLCCIPCMRALITKHKDSVSLHSHGWDCVASVRTEPYSLIMCRVGRVDAQSQVLGQNSL